MKQNSRTKREKKILFILLLAYVIIVLLFTYRSAILNAGVTREYYLTPVYEEVTTTIIKDSQTRHMEFVVEGPEAVGLTLDHYDRNEVVVRGQTLTFTIQANGKTQTKEAALDDQENGENIYVEFDEPLQTGTQISVDIESNGLGARGIVVAAAADGTPGLSLCSVTEEKTDIKGILRRTAAALLVGIILFIYLIISKRPLWKNRKFSKGEKVSATCNNHRKRTGGTIRKTLLSTLMVAGILGLFWEYVYQFRLQDYYTKSVPVFNFTDYRFSKKKVDLSDSEELTVCFMAKNDVLNGVAVEISGDYTDYDDAQNMRIVCTVKAEDGATVGQASALVVGGDAAQLWITGGVNSRQVSLLKKYTFIPFEESLVLEAGKKYYIVYGTENVASDAPIQLVATQDITADGSSSSDNTDLTTVLKTGALQASEDQPQTVLMYRNTSFVGFFVKMAVILTLFGSAIFAWGMYRRPAVENIFLVSILVLGMTISILVPPFCVPDERAHVETAYRISNQMLGISNEAGPGRILVRQEDLDGNRDNTMRITNETYLQLVDQIFEKCTDETLVYGYAGDVSQNVVKVVYYPAALGFTIARLLHLNTVTMVLFGRWLTLLTAAILMYFGIRVLPMGKALFAITSMVPMMLQMEASCSYDALTNAFAILFIGYCLHIVFDADATAIDIAICILAGVMTAFNKGGAYAPLLGLLVLVPVKRPERRKVWVIGILLMAVLGITAFFLKYHSLMDVLSAEQVSVTRGYLGPELYTMNYLLSSPGLFIRIVENTLLSGIDTIYGSMIARKLGYLELNAPWILIFVYTWLFLLAACWRENGNELKLRMSDKIYIWVLVLAGVLIISAELLLGYTTIGSSTVEGLQGRYFLPYMGLVFLVTGGRRIIIERIDDTIITLMGTLTTIVSIGMILFSALE